MSNTYVCDKCGQNFSTDFLYQRHLNRKTPCKKTEIIIENNIRNDDGYYGGPAKANNPKFDITRLYDPDLEGGFSALLCASKRAGKTNLLAAIYPEFEKVFDIIIFFSDTLHNKKYSFVKEPKFKKFIPEVIQIITEFQNFTNNAFKVLVILDDCSSEAIKSDNALMQLYLTGRNNNISCIISTQASTLINKKNRGNTDFVFIGKINTAENRLNLINSFLANCVELPKEVHTKIAKEAYLDKYILQNTEDHHFIVIDYENMGERVYDYKAKAIFPTKKKSG